MSPRAGDKRAAILDAAQTIFARQGYHSAQISRIAAEASVASGTVYLYFKNKPDLLVCLFRERLAMLIAAARSAFPSDGPPEEKLRQFIRQHLHAMASQPELATVTQIEMRQADANVQYQISQLMKGYFEVIDEIIAQGQTAGAFLPGVQSRQIRNLIFGTLDQTVTAWVLSGFRFDLEALSEPTYQLIVGGVAGHTEGWDLRSNGSVSEP